MRVRRSTAGHRPTPPRTAQRSNISVAILAVVASVMTSRASITHRRVARLITSTHRHTSAGVAEAGVDNTAGVVGHHLEVVDTHHLNNSFKVIHTPTEVNHRIGVSDQGHGK